MLSRGKILLRRAHQLRTAGYAPACPHNSRISNNGPRARSANLSNKPPQHPYTQHASQQPKSEEVSIRRKDLATGPLSYHTSHDRITLQSTTTAAVSSATAIFDAAALRDGCRCAQCRDGSSGQKTFVSTEVPAAISIASVREGEHGLRITYENEIARFRGGEGKNDVEHETTLSWESIELALGARSKLAVSPPPRLEAVRELTGVTFWDGATATQQVRKIDYDEFIHSSSSVSPDIDNKDNDAFWAVMQDLVRLGIVYLKNVPREGPEGEAAAARIASLVGGGSIRETFYGRVFDVRARQDADNVAYTAAALGLHQDLLYLEPPPRVQILHCLESSHDQGGESLFGDGERAGRLLLAAAASTSSSSSAAAAVVERLCGFAVPYAYTGSGRQIRYFQRRPVLHLDAGSGAFRNVFWSPPFQGSTHTATATATSTTNLLGPWLGAAHIFDRLINSPRAVFRARMEPGDCVLFDNLRVLHGRTAFDNAAGGRAGRRSRWLRGAYVAEEDFASVAARIPRRCVDGGGGGGGGGRHEAGLLEDEAWMAEVREVIDEEMNS